MRLVVTLKQDRCLIDTRTVAPQATKLPQIKIPPGAMGIVAAGREVPFVPAQIVYFYGLPKDGRRGRHAHRTVQQFFFCPYGSIESTIETAQGRQTIQLSEPETGLYVAPMSWVEIRALQNDTVVLLLMSKLYDERDYIRDYGEFCRLVGIPNSQS